MTHEDFGRSHKVAASSDRTFGLTFAALFLLVAFAPLLHASHQGVRWWALGLSALFAALACFWTAPLVPLKQLWMRVTSVVGHIVSQLTLALLFIVVIVPIGLLMRGLGRDALRLRPRPTAKTYWIDREPSRMTDSMKNQF